MNFKGILLVLVLLFSANSFAKGMQGTYSITGRAYDENGELIRNGKFTVMFKDQREVVETDSLGHYRFEVSYATACPSEFRGFARRKVNRQLNPKFLTLNYGEHSLRIKNKWKKFCCREVDSRKLDLHFI